MRGRATHLEGLVDRPFGSDNSYVVNARGGPKGFPGRDIEDGGCVYAIVQ